MIDLHMHTHFSDGRATPEELVQHAHSVGIKTIAVTDHDTVRGNLAARPFAAALGMTVLPAIEMTTYWDGYGNVDLLGYFMDVEDGGFQAMIADSRADLRERITHCCQILTEMGLPISYEDLLAQNPRSAAAMQVIQVLQSKGYAVDFNTGLMLFRHAWEQVRPCALTSQQAIERVHGAGGVVSLAHPTRIRVEWLTADEVKPLVDTGLDSIEVIHPSVDAEARSHFETIAARFDLAMSGGSDEHGYPEGFPRMGRFNITLAMLDALRNRAETS